MGELKRLLAFGLALITTFALSFGVVSGPAQAQITDIELEDIIFGLTVSVDEGECGAGGCPEDERPVTFTALLTADAESTLDLTAEQLAQLNAALDASVFDIEVTDSEGNTQTVESGEAVCLPPGETTVTATAVEADVAAALEEFLDITEDPLLEITADNITIGEFTNTFVVAACPDDGAPPPDDDDDAGDGGPIGDGNIVTGSGDDQVLQNLTAGQCQAIINNNSGNQYDASIIQACTQIINEINLGGGNGENGNGGNGDNGNGNGDNGNGIPGPGDSVTTLQYGGNGVPGDVITSTIPKKGLPVTGGLPLLGLAGLLLAGLGVGLSVLRAGTRDRR